MVIECINMCFELCTNYKATRFLVQLPQVTGDVRGNIKMHCMYLHLKLNSGGFPGGAVVENLPANAGDTGSSPGLGRSLHAAEQLGP